MTDLSFGHDSTTLLSSVTHRSHFDHNSSIFSGDENFMVSHMTPFLDKKKRVEGFAFPFSFKPIRVKLISLFSKTKVLKSVTA